MALVVEVLALVALTIDAGPGDAGCVCADRWDCPLWCWLRWLRSLALVVEVLASVALALVMLAVFAQTVGTARCGAG